MVISQRIDNDPKKVPRSAGSTALLREQQNTRRKDNPENCPQAPKRGHPQLKIIIEIMKSHVKFFEDKPFVI